MYQDYQGFNVPLHFKSGSFHWVIDMPGVSAMNQWNTGILAVVVFLFCWQLVSGKGKACCLNRKRNNAAMCLRDVLSLDGVKQIKWQQRGGESWLFLAKGGKKSCKGAICDITLLLTCSPLSISHTFTRNKDLWIPVVFIVHSTDLVKNFGVLECMKKKKTSHRRYSQILWHYNLLNIVMLQFSAQ